MTLRKAIEILQDIRHTCLSDKRQDEEVAVGLGIEALKEVKEFRIWFNEWSSGPIPGETKEL